jgi:hypothetical protein
VRVLLSCVPAQAIQQLPGRKPSVEAVGSTPAMDVFAQLAGELDNEGRYHLLNAAANHLRFPNVHTHYFSSLMLALFSNAKEVRRRASPSVPHVRERLTIAFRHRYIIRWGNRCPMRIALSSVCLWCSWLCI